MAHREGLEAQLVDLLLNAGSADALRSGLINWIMTRTGARGIALLDEAMGPSDRVVFCHGIDRLQVDLPGTVKVKIDQDYSFVLLGASPLEPLGAWAPRLSGLVCRIAKCVGRQEALQRNLLAMKGAGLGLWDWDIPSGHVTSDRCWAEMLGRRPEDIISNISEWATLVHPDDMPDIKAALAAHFADETHAYEITHRMMAGDGRWRWILNSGQVVARDVDGAPIRMVGIHRDITRARDAELALAEERALFLNGRVMVFKWRHAEHWPVEYISPSAEGLLGHAAEALYAGRVRYASLSHPDDLPRVGAEVAAALASGADEFVHEDYRIVRPDGSVRWLHDHTTMLRDGDTVTHFLGYVVDVTARREAEADRAAMDARLGEAQRMESLALMAGGIAHDFNNLLVGILGNADLLRMDMEGDDPNGDCLDDILTSASKARALVGQLLAYSGGGVRRSAVFDLNRLVREMARLIHISAKRRVLIVSDLSVGQIAIEGDENQLRQVMLNLVTNATEVAAPGSEVRLKTGLRDFSEAELARSVVASNLSAGVAAFIEVADVGPGMTPDILERIFDPFFSTKGSGRGLGLAAVLGIVRSHGGALLVDSEVAVGTRFVVVLPPTSAPVAVPVGVAPSAGITLLDPDARVMLLIDDERTVRDVASRMLRRLGYEVDVASDGERGLACFEANPTRYGAVMLDLTMPGLDGLACLARIRALSSETPVLLSSGHSEREIPEIILKDPRLRSLSKPYTFDALAGALGELLSGAAPR